MGELYAPPHLLKGRGYGSPFGDAEIAGVEIAAPDCRGGNRGRRKSMDSEGFKNVFLTILIENRVMILAPCGN